MAISDNLNIRYVPETNWSVLDNDAEVWNGSLPFDTGMEFPTKEIKERATISKTNKLIYDNNPDEIYNSILSIIPEIDPMYGWQIREIVMHLPYFKNSTNSWVGLIAGDTPLINTSEESDIELSEIIENSNFSEIFQSEVRSRFLDVVSAYRVEKDITGKPFITPIATKNLIIYVNENMPNSIEVVVVFSIYTNEQGEFVDFVEYHYNGFIRKTKFEYRGGLIGEKLEVEEDRAFGGKYDISPIVVFRHNTTGNNVYGTDQFRYWIPSMLGAMRAMQNLLRLGERTREMIRKVPDSAIRKNPNDGSSVFINQGTIGYSEGADKFPEIEYVVPEIRIDEALKVLEAAIRQVSIDAQLGIAFFDTSVLGSRLSSESIEASMLPARLEAKRIVTEMRHPIKELLVKLGCVEGVYLDSSKLSIEFFDGFPRDIKKETEAVQSRLNPENQSITLVDAIMRLDRVPLKVAKRKALEILEERDELINSRDSILSDIRDGESEMEEVEISDIKPTAGVSTDDATPSEFIDNTVWNNQMLFRPRDIPQGRTKGGKRLWIRRRSREKE